MYKKEIINAFQGLNSTVSPELIKDGEARDILNLRMDKVGKLINRNGRYMGLFLEAMPNQTAIDYYGAVDGFAPPPDLEDIGPDEPYRRVQAATRNLGMIGIGEYILDGYWDTIDAQRVMVYYVRTEFHIPKLIVTVESTTPYYDWDKGMDRWDGGIFLFSPIEGKYKDKLLLAPRFQYGSQNPSDTPYGYSYGGSGVSGDRGDYPAIAFSFRRDDVVNGYDFTGSKVLFAPNRYTYTNTPTEINETEPVYLEDSYVRYSGVEDAWIEHYTTMNEYRHKLIISDRINGDMIIEDEITRSNVATGKKNTTHELRLRPNIIDKFNVDYVTLDFRFGTGQENDMENGVKTPMLLMKYDFKKEYTAVTEDHFKNELSNPDWIGETVGEEESVELMRKYATYFKNRQQTTFLTYFLPRVRSQVNIDQTIYKNESADGYKWDESIPGLSTNGIASNDLDFYAGFDSVYSFVTGEDEHWSTMFYIPYMGLENKYTFTNAETVSEYLDLFSKPSFTKSEYDDETDARYLSPIKWDDYEINYYPTVGKNDNVAVSQQTLIWENGRLLNGKNREFDQINPTPIKITTLKEQDVYEATIPIAVWEYRFVWDYGDGNYSAPSTILSCPDIMWSATKDSDYDGSDYIRPIYLGGLDVNDEIQLQGQLTEQSTGYSGDEFPTYYDTPAVFSDASGSWELTAFGERLKQLKDKIYSKAEHRFNPEVPTDTHKSRGEFTTFVTGLANDRVVFDGIAAEYISVNDMSYEGFRDNSYHLLSASVEKTRHFTKTGKLILPIFKKEGSTETYNSLCDEEGRLRTSYSVNEYKPATIVSENGGWEYATHSGISGQTNERCNRIITINNELAFFGQTPILSIADSLLYDDTVKPIVNLTSQQQTPLLMYGEAVGYSDTDLYINIIADGDAETGKPKDYNNKDDVSADFNRPNTITRLVSTEQERLSFTQNDLSAEIHSRLFVNGLFSINALNTDWYGFESKYYCTAGTKYGFTNSSEEDYYKYPAISKEEQLGYEWFNYRHRLRKHSYTEVKVKSLGTDIFTMRNSFEAMSYDRYVALKADITSEDGFDYMEKAEYPHVKATAYFEAERFMGVEQLTQVLPSSVLFEAPRISLHMGMYTIPKRAKNILIYRTRATHSNLYQPNVYGLVEKLKIEHDEDDNIIEINYFDTVKDDALDFSSDIMQYDAMDTAIRSRFNVSLNERTYYANYKEELKPKLVKDPSTMIAGSNVTQDPFMESVLFKSMPVTPDDEADTNSYLYDASTPDWVEYLFIYEDKLGVLSNEEEWRITAAPENTMYFAASYQIDADQATTADGENKGTTDQYYIGLNLISSQYDGSIRRVNIYRHDRVYRGVESTDPNYYYVGSIVHEDEGIFIDKHQKGGVMPSLLPERNVYESAVRWSEAYQPDFIKLESFQEYKAGDGEQITGLETLYGNLIIFKETSCHRSAVQGRTSPISRTDELTNELGCIAPNALINVNNTLYFLSWKGLIKYDNNRFEKIDGPFDVELQHRIQFTKDYIRDASLAYNPQTDELMLTMPMPVPGFEPQDNAMIDAIAETDDPKIDLVSSTKYFKEERELVGNVYVISLTKQYATKYAYPYTAKFQSRMFDPEIEAVNTRPIYANNTRQTLMKYKVNSLGELRGGDIVPRPHDWLIHLPEYDAYAGLTDTTQITAEIVKLTGVEKDTDAIINNDDPVAVKAWDWFLLDTKNTTMYPNIAEFPIQTIFKSKFFQGNVETIVKRVRKNLFNIYSKGMMEFKLFSTNDAKTYTNTNSYNVYQTEEFNPTISYSAGYYDGVRTTDDTPVGPQYTDVIGLGSNYISIINKRNAVQDSITLNDDNGKPINYSIQLNTEYYTNINEIGFYWRIIHKHLK